MALRSNRYKNKDKLLITRNKQRKKYYKQSQGNKPKIWTVEEINLVLKSEITDRELASQLNRSVASIQVKRCNCKKSIQSI